MKKLLAALLVFLTICLSGCVTINIYYNGAEKEPENVSSAPSEGSSEEESSSSEESAPSGSESGGEDSEGPQEEPSGAESGDEQKPYDAKYAKSGTFDYEQSLNTVTIQAGDVVLKNKTVLKRLYVRSGSVTLENCIVSGTLIFSGGGSLVLKNCTVASAEVESGENAVLKLSGSRIDALSLRADCAVEASGGGSSVGSVTVAKAGVSATADALAVGSAVMEEAGVFRLQNGSSVDGAEVYASCTLSSDKDADCVYKKVSVLPGRGYVKIKLRVEDARIGELYVEESVYPELVGEAKIDAYSGDGNIYTS